VDVDNRLLIGMGVVHWRDLRPTEDPGWFTAVTVDMATASKLRTILANRSQSQLADRTAIRSRDRFRRVYHRTLHDRHSLPSLAFVPENGDCGNFDLWDD